jgi:lysophospholipase L1-like esterase
MRIIWVVFLCLAMLMASSSEKRDRRIKVLFMGSSSISSWTTLARDFSEMNIVNIGMNGARLSDYVPHAYSLIEYYAPRTVVIYAGENDLHWGASSEDVCSSYARIVGSVPGMRIVFITIKPSPSRWINLAEKIRQANSCIKQFAAEKERLLIADVYPLMLDQNGEPNVALFRSDMLHMNSAGYELWISVVAPLIKQ